MIIYYSSGGRMFGDPAIALGDNANVMHTFYLMYESGRMMTVAFERLVKARRRKRKTGKPYKPWRAYKLHRRNETLYSIRLLVRGEWFTINTTPLLFSLKRDCCNVITSDVERAYIVRHEANEKWTKLYKWKNDSWISLRKY